MAVTVDQSPTDDQRALSIVLRGLPGALARGGRAPALAAALSRAERVPAPVDFGPLALSLFGLPADGAQAPYVRLACGRAPDTRWWLRAAPVALVADLDRVHLSYARDPALDSGAAAALAAPLAAHLGATDIALEVLTAHEWSVGLPRPLAVATHEPEAAERDMHAALPAGESGPMLRALMTELQMLMHGHAVNASRASAGLPALNGVWLWGGGAEAVHPSHAPARVVAEDLLLVGLARAAGVALSSGPLNAPGLMEIDLRGETERLRAFDGETLPTALGALSAGTVDALVFYPGGGAGFRLTRRGRWRVWRRPIELTELLARGEPPV